MLYSNEEGGGSGLLYSNEEGEVQVLLYSNEEGEVQVCYILTKKVRFRSVIF